MGTGGHSALLSGTCELGLGGNPGPMHYHPPFAVAIVAEAFGLLDRIVPLSRGQIGSFVVIATGLLILALILDYRCCAGAADGCVAFVKFLLRQEASPASRGEPLSVRSSLQS